MPFSLNRVQLIGTLGKDAENSFTTSNLSISKFSIATTHSHKTSDGQWENLTTWSNVTAFGLNDFLKEQLKKGAKFYVEGRIDHQKYEKDGQTKYFTSIIADFNGLIPLDRRDNATEPISSNEGAQDPEANKPEPINSELEDDPLPF